MATREVLRGSLALHKKKRVEERFFVLFEDRLDYFADVPSAAAKEAEPRGRVHLREVESVEEVREGVLLRAHSGAELVLHTPLEHGEAWVSMLRNLLSQAPLCEGVLEVRRKGEFAPRYFVLHADSLTYFQQVEDWRAGQAPRGVCALSDITGLEPPLTLRMRAPLKSLEMRADGSDTELWADRIDALLAPRTLREGELSHMKSERAESRWACLQPELFEYFNAREDRREGRPPRGQLALADVRSVCVRGGRITVELSGRDLELQADSDVLARAWGSTWELALGTSKVRWEEAEDPVDGAVGAIQGLLRRKSMRATNLFQEGRYKSCKDGLLDEHCLREVCGEAGLELSLEQSRKALASMDTSGKGKLNIGDLEAALRRHHRSNVRQRSVRPSRAEGQALVGDVAERAKAKLRSAAYSCGGVNWSGVFGHYAKGASGIDLPSFISMVRRDVKIAYRDVPDAALAEVFAAIDTNGKGSVSYEEFVVWLGVKKEAEREVQEEHAAVRIQAAVRGRKARRRTQQMKARSAQLLRRGNFDVELRDGSREPWAVAAYEDRLECHAASGAWHRIPRRDIKDLEVLQRTLIVDVRGGVRLKFHTPEDVCLEEWIGTLCRVCGGSAEVRAADSEGDVPWSSDGDEDPEPSASMASMATTAASAAPTLLGQPKQRIGKAELAALVRNNPTIAGFLGVPQLPPAALEEALRQASRGRQDISLEELTTFLNNSASSGSAPSASATSRPPAAASRPKRPWTVSPELLPEMPQLEGWLASLSDPPVHCGLLDFHEAHGEVQRFCLLFADRLDAWDSCDSAAGGHLPRMRLRLREVRSVEMVRGGFMLSLNRGNGRRLALRPKGGDVRGWSAALHGLLPAKPSPSRSPSRQRQRSSPRSLVPRCAPASPPPMPRTPRPVPRGRDDVRINTHSSGIQACMLLHGAEAMVRPLRPQAISAKVNPREVPLPGPPQLAEKVNTPRFPMTALGPTAAADVCSKVTGEPRGRSASPRPQVTAKITGNQRSFTPHQNWPSGKITETNRGPAMPRTRSSSPVMGKITDAGREARGWAGRAGAPACVDKMRPIGAPTGGAVMTRVLF